ncbi:protein kinase domain-containing protein [Pseudoxanthomonas dokdonensis]|uniref:protein kinase domain-containing protein n=1 Tax=Pseudoxanthomonas dokdonensis TaxID=344882 RepID=UPI000709B268|nr:winged helix-turn-helix domain-containing protein [Pseudoxanthomonas dokdonensis]
MEHQDSSATPGAPLLGVWRFGDAVLDEQQAALRLGGSSVDLDRSGYDVLLALLKHAGEVVTKEELLEAGWPGRVVSENSLAKAVSRLRQALGAQGASLRAVHGYGYRLATPVSYLPVNDSDAGTRPDTEPELHAGDALPHRPGWRLLRRLGEGSMGVTYLVVGPQGQQRVVKFATGEAGLRGLKREVALSRYIGAVRADLPNIARVISWNLSSPPFFIELPYFAQGHLGEWATQADGLATLSRAQRVDMCAQLCDTVAGLHEIGVIHKDLKPENLYPVRDAAGDWRIVLSDLGAAEAVQTPRMIDLGITLSIAAEHLRERAGSLLYLAPEVIAGEMPTQRSDVFALGVLVYQLLVGDMRRSLAPGWEAAIDDELLCDDIALAAAATPLRRRPARGFGRSLRHLDERRAQAQQRKDGERQRLLMQQLVERQRARRPWLMATAATLALGLGVGSLLYLKALDAGREARENAAIADAVNRFFNQDVLGAASPYASSGKHEPTVREALDQAVLRIDDRLHDQPIVEASVRMTIGRVYGEAMQISQAIEQERRGVDLFERHLGPGDRRTQQARYHLATDLTDDSRFVEARTLIDATDALRDKLDMDDVETTLLSHRAGCYWYIRRAQYDAGLAACEGVVDSQLAFDPDDHAALIKARSNLAVLHSRAGRIDKAEAQFVKVDESFTALDDQDSPMRLRVDYLHGMNLLALGRYDQAAHRLQAAYQGSVAALGADNPHTLEVQMGLAKLHVLRSQVAAAVPLLRHAYTAYKRQLGEDSHFTMEAREALDAARCELARDKAANRDEAAARCLGAGDSGSPPHA